MAILLKELYEETKETYGLQLLAGGSGLDHTMSWVYISEDPGTLEFLQGGELIITTGILCDGKEWLEHFISGLMQCKTCGLIINTGRYLLEDAITAPIREMCDQAGFPLFLMPWETHIFDITHDYYNRIFQDTQTNQAISTAFSRVILHPDEPALLEISLPVLAEHGFERNQIYSLAYVSYDSAISPSNLLSALQRLIKLNNISCTPVPGNGFILLISKENTRFRMENDISVLLYHLKELFPCEHIHIGISNTADTLPALSKSFFQGQAAAVLAQQKNRTLFFFDDMGFYKVLLSVEDKNVLINYVNEKLGAVADYDKRHNSYYMDTLYQYLICDGSIQKIAGALFCHRNTVNYRIRILKEELHLALDNPEAKFELMTAFQIQNYLSSFPL